MHWFAFGDAVQLAVWRTFFPLWHFSIGNSTRLWYCWEHLMWIRPFHCCNATVLQTDDKVHLHFWAVGLGIIMERFFFLFFFFQRPVSPWKTLSDLAGRQSHIRGKRGKEWMRLAPRMKYLPLKTCIAEPSPLAVARGHSLSAVPPDLCH